MTDLWISLRLSWLVSSGLSLLFFSWFEFDSISIPPLFYGNIIGICQICVVEVGVVKLIWLPTSKQPYHGIPRITIPISKSVSAV